MSLPLDLLSQARQLAAQERHRPKQASLRRAVSSAYYALFHFICEESVKLFAGAAHQDRAKRDLARRAIAHTRLKDVCLEFQKITPRLLLRSFWPALSIANDPDFAILCGNLIDLQEARHTADYDFLTPISRFDALDACDKAERAMKAWSDLKKRNPEALSFFAMTILLWPGLAAR